MKLSDLAEERIDNGKYTSYLRLYFVPDWQLQKVTFYDVNGEEIMSRYALRGTSFTDIPEVPEEGCVWVYANQNGTQDVDEEYGFTVEDNTDV